MELFQLIPCGGLLYDIVSIDGKSWEVSFFIRETPAIMKMYGERPKIEITAGLLEEKEASPFVVIIKFNNNIRLMYEVWFNFYSELGKISFYLLKDQKKIIFNFINNENEITRSISFDNYFKPWVEMCEQIINNRDKWSMEDFDIAKKKICAKYSSVKFLHDKLSFKSNQ